MSKATLLCGDCLELMNRIPDGSIDMVLSDLPYGTTRCRWDTPINLQELWKQYRRVVKENGAIVLFSAQPFTTELISSNKAMYRYEWIWKKTQPSGFMNAKKMPLRTHENIEIFYRKPPTYNPQMTHGHQRTDKTIPVEVYSDSNYVVETMNGHFAMKKNRDLWRKLMRERQKFTSIRFIWVKGHDKNQHNNDVDRQAVAESRKALEAQQG